MKATQESFEVVTDPYPKSVRSPRERDVIRVAVMDRRITLSIRALRSYGVGSQYQLTPESARKLGRELCDLASQMDGRDP